MNCLFDLIDRLIAPVADPVWNWMAGKVTPPEENL